MYFKGTLTVDPSKLTKIEVVKPEGSFKQLFYNITGGKIGDKREVETFKALSLIQQIYATFASMGINNIIRLNHDDIEIYFDNEGKKDDFKHAADKYSIEIDDSMSSFFDTLWLVLEHEDNTFKYLIEISINRNHKVSEYPIEIIVSGLLKNIEGDKVGTKEDLKQKVGNVFNSQEEYDKFIEARNIAFNDFLSKLAFELKKQIRVDDVQYSSKQRLMIPRDKKAKASQVQDQERPVYGDAPYGYFGFGDFLLTSMLWSELCFDSGMHIANTELIDETGSHLTDVGAEGMDAVEGSVFDENVDVDESLGDMDSPDIPDADGGDMMGDATSSVADSDGGGFFDSIMGDMDFGDFDFDL